MTTDQTCRNWSSALSVQVMIKGPPDLQQFGCENKRGTAALASFDMASAVWDAHGVHPMSSHWWPNGFLISQAFTFYIFRFSIDFSSSILWGVTPNDSHFPFWAYVKRRNPLMPGETWVPWSHHQMSNLCESTQGQALRLSHSCFFGEDRLQNPSQPK